MTWGRFLFHLVLVTRWQAGPNMAELRFLRGTWLVCPSSLPEIQSWSPELKIAVSRPGTPPREELILWMLYLGTLFIVPEASLQFKILSSFFFFCTAQHTLKNPQSSLYPSNCVYKGSTSLFHFPFHFIFISSPFLLEALEPLHVK